MTTLQSRLDLAMSWPILAAIAAAALAVGVLPVSAAISQPDSVVYGQVSISGQPRTGSIVVARSGDVTLDSFTIGSDALRPDFYALRIAVSQATQDGPASPPDSAIPGSMVQILIDGMSFAEVTVQSGQIQRNDIETGEALCSGGSADGEMCSGDVDCPGGICVIAQAICSGGADDGLACECIGGTCIDGACGGGAAEGQGCDVGFNCSDGAMCLGTQRVCESGRNRGEPCLNDAQCGGSVCASTGLICKDGNDAGESCVEDDDCDGGTCGTRILPPTPMATATRTLEPTATPTPGESTCPGDCNADGTVSINELITMVNIALGNRDVDDCILGDGNGNGEIAINELIQAVNRALNGCDG